MQQRLPIRAEEDPDTCPSCGGPSTEGLYCSEDCLAEVAAGLGALYRSHVTVRPHDRYL